MDRKLSKSYVLFGGDYNPDQWDESIIYEDMKLFQEAGINTVTLPVFSWAKLEPSENTYCFEWLDKILDILEKNGIHYFLSTPTSAQPAWMSREYPEILPVDIAGRKRTHGMRVFFCVNSKKYRERAAAIAREMAGRYRNRKGLSGWHVANEYGTYCYCDYCQKKFRTWLQMRYGSVGKLNECWNTAFWGKTVYNFEEIMLPTEKNDDYRFHPAAQLDYLRFMTDSTIECYKNEADILKEATPDLPVFTNISGFIKKLDQFKMVENMDCAGWDNYPRPSDVRSFPALKHDIMRGLKDGESYYVTEQSPNQQNWQPYNKLKRPGEIRLLAYQGLAHGSDSCLYFQMRQSQGGQEKFHGAVISHNGRNDTRTFREVSRLGKELEKLGDRFITGKTNSKVGLIFDWDNWWALELCSGPTQDMDYLNEVHHYYKAFYNNNISVDILKMEADFSTYKVIVAPMLYMLKKDVAERLKEFVKGGGVLLGTYMTGYADENDRCVFGAYPGPLKDIFGLWVEETDALLPEEYNVICELNNTKKEFKCDFLCDLIHTETAEVLAVYKEDFYSGMPAVARNYYGEGKAYYFATRVDDEYLIKIVGELNEEYKLAVPFRFSGDIEIAVRNNDYGDTWFVLNHGMNEGVIWLGEERYENLLNDCKYAEKIIVKSKDVLVLKKIE